MDHSIFFVSAFKEHFVVSSRLSAFGHFILQVAPSAPFPSFQVVIIPSWKPISILLEAPKVLPLQLVVSQLILHLLIRVLAGQVRSVLAGAWPGDGVGDGPDDAAGVGDGADDAAGLSSHLAFSFAGRDHSIFPSAFLEHFVVSFKLSSSGHVRVQVAPSGPSGTFQVVVETPLSALVPRAFPKPPEHVTVPHLILHLLIRVLAGHLVPVLGPATGGLKVLEGDTILVVICGENVPLWVVAAVSFFVVASVSFLVVASVSFLVVASVSFLVVASVSPGAAVATGEGEADGEGVGPNVISRVMIFTCTTVVCQKFIQKI